MQNAPRGSPPLYFPNGFKLADAKVCAAFVDIAYDQYKQWQKAGNPPSSNFNSDKPSNGDSYSAPLFSTFIYYDIFGYKYVATEPFGFVAVDGNGNVYLAFRGTMPTAADGYADATIDQTAYEIVANYGLVLEGYYFIYQGFDSSISQAIANLSSSKPFQRFFLTGHSLGRGLLTLAVPDVLANTSVSPAKIPVMHYNFASPRVAGGAIALTQKFRMTWSNGPLWWRLLGVLVTAEHPAKEKATCADFRPPSSDAARLSTITARRDRSGCRWSWPRPQPPPPSGR